VLPGKCRFIQRRGKKAIIRDGPVKVLTSEHESGRYFVKELHEASLGLRQKNPSALARLRRALTLYAQMLRKHIAKEEEKLFLLAEVLLSVRKRKLAEDFEAADES
jgi:hemerythrin-like domain-containing protein